MNKNIEKLWTQLADTQHEEMDIKFQLQDEYNKFFESNKTLKNAIEGAVASKEFQFNSFGEVVSVYSFDFTNYQGCQEFITEYLKEYHFIDIDFDNDLMYYEQGPSIIINEDGDVYDQDSDKFVIYTAQYSSDSSEGLTVLDVTKRNKLIKEHMEKREFFPGIFRANGYGQLFEVSIKET